MRSSKVRRRGAWLALILGLGAIRGNLEAQDLTQLVSTCGTPSEAHRRWCEETALAIQAAQGALGLSASGGIDLPGSASTLGWRTKGSPRLALSVWGTGTRAPVPALNAVAGLPTGEATATLPAFHVSGTVGLFDGFSLGPTAGGFASLDLSISGQWIGAAKEVGLREGAAGWGAGARLGILRESFSLPGLSVTAHHRFMGSHTLWSVADGDPAEAAFDLEVSSLRALLGKDVRGIGFFGGVGWDRYRGDASLLVTDPGGGDLDSRGSGEVRSSRRVVFLGASRTFLALQISGEIGWGEGFDSSFSSSSGSTPGGFDPASASYFGALAIRLTF